MIVAVPLQSLSRQARPYPAHLLRDSGAALALFAAGFLGWNDCIHFARARMTCTCVDTDGENIAIMKNLYPGDWNFHVEDAWEFAERAVAEGRTWEVVSIDPFFETCAQQVWDDLDLWLPLSSGVITLTVHGDTELALPRGWKRSYFPRGHDVGWAVLKRA